MRLSDAIALGRTLLRPKPYITIRGDEGCALGMAMAANGCRSHEEGVAKATRMAWSWLNLKPTVRPCPCNPEDDYVLSWAQSYQAYVAHIFNEHVCGAKDWTLDQLIDWVRANEPAEAAEEKRIAELAPSLVAQV